MTNKFNIGDKVKFIFSNTTGTVIREPNKKYNDSEDYCYHIERDDGMKGGGVLHNGKATWLCNESDLEEYIKPFKKKFIYDNNGYIIEDDKDEK